MVANRCTIGKHQYHTGTEFFRSNCNSVVDIGGGRLFAAERIKTTRSAAESIDADIANGPYFAANSAEYKRIRFILGHGKRSLAM